MKRVNTHFIEKNVKRTVESETNKSKLKMSRKDEMST